MKILYLAHRIPFPPNKGDKIRSFHQLKYLSENHQLDLVCLADNSDDLKYQSDLEKICHRVAVFPLTPLLGKLRGILSLSRGNTISVHYFYQKNMQKVVDQWLDETEYDAIICFSSVMAEYLFRSSNRQVQAKFSSAGQGAEKIPHQLLMDFCDVDSDKWAQYSRDAKLPLNIIYH